MSPRRAQSISCTCGQVQFDVSDHKVGDTLTCPWCKKEYHYLGGDQIEPLKKSGGVEVVEGSVEVFKHDVPDEAEKVSESDISSRMKRHSHRRKRKPGTSVKTDEGKAGEAPKPKQREIPGGIMPMVGFIVAFNGIALVLILVVLFPSLPGGKYSTPWGDSLGPMRIPWLHLTALLLGHVTGFLAWAAYVYRLHKREKAQAAEGEGAAGPAAGKKGGESRRAAKPAVVAREKKPDDRKKIEISDDEEEEDEDVGEDDEDEDDDDLEEEEDDDEDDDESDEEEDEDDDDIDMDEDADEEEEKPQPKPKRDR